MRECRVGLPIVGARKAFGGAVGGGGVEVGWIGKRGGGWCEDEGVDGGLVGNEGCDNFWKGGSGYGGWGGGELQSPT